MKNILLGFCLLISGCTGYQYVASPHYVPVNTEKGKFAWNASLNYFQAGYALTNHFSLFASGYYRNNEEDKLNSSDFGIEGSLVQTDLHRQVEAGLTFYKVVDDYISFELVTGVGNGFVKYSDKVDFENDYEFLFNSKKLNYYIQPVFSARYDKYFDFSFFTRFNQTRFYDTEKSLRLGSNTVPEKCDQYLYDNENVKLLFFEPGFQFRVGVENVKFQFMYSRSVDLENTGIQLRKSNLYAGISIRIDFKKNKKSI